MWLCGPRKPWFLHRWWRCHRPYSTITGFACANIAHIPAVLHATRCLACRDPRATSADGERGHQKTGVCQECWTLLMADAEESRREAITRCTRLAGKDACRYVLCTEACSKFVFRTEDTCSCSFSSYWSQVFSDRLL